MKVLTAALFLFVVTSLMWSPVGASALQPDIKVILKPNAPQPYPTPPVRERPAREPREPAPSPPALMIEMQGQFDEIDSFSRRAPTTANVTFVGDTESEGRLFIRVQQSRGGSPRLGGARSTQSQEYTVDLGFIEQLPDDVFIQIVKLIFSRGVQNGAGFLDGVKVKQIGATADYEVVEDYSYQYGPNKITVPKGFRYDRASIPRIFWLLIDKDSLSNVAPLFHDLLYRNGGRLEQNLVSPYRTFSKEDTDNLFFELMGKCGVNGWRQLAAYQAVKNLAQSSWRGQ